MATDLNSENEDLITCSTCLSEYNEESRRPKCLPCSHTVCLSCLLVIECKTYVFLPVHIHLQLFLWKKQEIRKRQVMVSCPLCHKSVASEVEALPDNNSTLLIIKLNQKIKCDQEQKEKDAATLSPNEAADSYRLQLTITLFPFPHWLLKVID